MGIVFASYGNSAEFYKKGYKSSFEAPKYLKNMGLNGYEYLCNQGVHISSDGCEVLKKNAEENKISLSVRGYDFLSMSDVSEEKRKENFEIIKNTMMVAYKTGAKRVVLPLDNCAIKSRAFVKKETLKMLNEVVSSLKREGISDVFIALETMGLIHDYGTFSEIVSLCRENEMFLPCINVGNLYGRNLGKETEEDEFCYMFEYMKKNLGEYRGNNFHLYYSKVEYTNQGFRDNVDFCTKGYETQNYKKLINAVVTCGVTPFIVEKSPTTSDVDTLEIKKYYMKKSEENV